MRSLVVATLYGRGGLQKSAEAVHEGDLPAGKRLDQVEGVVVPVLGQLIARYARHLTDRSALTVPAVLAGLGIAVHHTMPWSEPKAAFRTDDLVRLLDDIHWEREAKYWDGIAAKAGTSGCLNCSGVKDSGGRVADAILYPATETGRRIRGL
ncbi:hypothetical protein [Streptomyces prasinus]|uniref:hypothetical protein n=1 Tax=Streptomyces prasinus TaxID=67345 RepID=UPI0036A6394F